MRHCKIEVDEALAAVMDSIILDDIPGDFRPRPFMMDYFPQLARPYVPT